MSSLNLVSETKTPAPTGDLLREANHRISNHLALLTAMVRSQISGIDKGPEILSRAAAKEMLVAATGKLVSVSRLHHRLSEQSHPESIFLSEYLVDLCASLVSSLGLRGRMYFAHKWKADCRLSPEQAQYLGLLLNEVMINALKHAHPTGLPVQLEICCERRANGRVTIVIADDGVGLSEEENTKGVGFKLIHALAKSLNAELRIESDSLGLTHIITLPPSVDAVKCLSVVAAE
jgi:two-component sensor histidine kinase